MAANYVSDGDDIVKTKDAAYFAFGRFQPPTLGHKILISELAAKRADADPYVFVSSSIDNEKNPLSVNQKIYWLNKLRGADEVKIIDTTAKDCTNPAAAFHKLREAGYKIIKIVAGSDRAPQYLSIIKSLKKGGEFSDIELGVHKSGEDRDPDAEGAAGMSGTKMRAAAMANNIGKLRAGTGLNDSNARILIDQIKHGLTKKTVKRTVKRTVKKTRGRTRIRTGARAGAGSESNNNNNNNNYK